MPLEKFIIKQVNYRLYGFQQALNKLCSILQMILFKRVTKTFQKKIKEVQKKQKISPKKGLK